MIPIRKFKQTLPLRLPLVFIACLGALLIILSLNTAIAAAQTEGEIWSEPLNLSNSGGGGQPWMVVDYSGVLHVIWEDAYDGLVYSFKSKESWSTPIPVSLPFDGRPPILLPTRNGRIHAFWIDKEELLYSRAVAGSFADGEAWTAPEVIGRSAVKVAGVVDLQDVIHIAYVRTLDTQNSPAGIYYRNTLDQGVSWSLPENLYASPYMRGLDAASTHVSIASGVSQDIQDAVYVTWDNRPRKQVFLSISSNGGRDWREPFEIDKPEPGIRSGLPYNIHVTASGWNVLLVWQNGDPGAACTQYYQWSPNHGDVWFERETLLTGLTGCASENRLLPLSDNNSLLISSWQNQNYLLAWDGVRWSEPQTQRKITSFSDPVTFENVNLGCRQFTYHPGEDKLFLAGCDIASGGDIWVSSRMVGDISTWFSQSPLWGQPEVVISGEQSYISPTLVYGANERLHAFWTQIEDGFALNNTYSIFYSRYENQRWTRSTAVLKSPDGFAGPVSVILTSDKRLVVIWSDGASGKLYISCVDESRAMIPSEWIEHPALPAPFPAVRSPFVLEAEGILYVSYALPLNEGRGIYLTTSPDFGQTWTEPIQIFDAAAAGWAMVDQPKIALTADGSLNALFTRYSLPGGSGSEALYYSRSTDRGLTWSSPDQVVENPVSWSRLVFHQAQGLHRLWQETSAGRIQVFHQYSSDFGLTWSRAAPVGTASMQTGPVDLAVDPTGRLHLLQSVQDFNLTQSIQHWQWERVFWTREETLPLSNTGELEITSLHAAVSENGRLGVVINHPKRDPEMGLVLHELSFSYREIELPSEPLAALPAFTPEPSPTPDATPLPQVLPTPTVDLSLIYSEYVEINNSDENRYFGLFLGVGLALGVVGAAVGVGIRGIRRRGRENLDQ
jgi:hypothetical protein